LEAPTTRADRFLQICAKIHPKAVLIEDPDLTFSLGLCDWRLQCSTSCWDHGRTKMDGNHNDQWAPNHTVVKVLARYWTTPDMQRGHRHLSAPVAVFARLVLAMVSALMPVGRWSTTRFRYFSKCWQDNHIHM
jgi:hypothetical protein